LLSRFAAPALSALLALGVVQPASAGMGDRPGDFDYYALVLSWSPSFCLSGNGSHEGDPQCGTVRPYAFVLHGLWPQFDVRWPESCDVGSDSTTVPPALAQSMLDIMPSDKLVQHEYEKHGTCSGLDMGAYFLMARRLFTSINVPPKYVNLSGELQEPLDQLRSDLLSANPQFKPGMIAVDCDKRGRLVEVHFCYSKTGEPQNCGRNEIQAKMCRQDAISMPPVRGHAAGATPDASAATPSQPGATPDDGSPAAANDNGTTDTPSSSHHRHRHHRTFYNN
jgi:ribonuclease T2